MMDKLQPGDVFATANKGVIGWLAHKMMAPKTTRFHYGLIVGSLEDLIKLFGITMSIEEVLKLLGLPYSANDYIILESLDKGPSVGYLSKYKGRDIKFYRPDRPEENRHLAPLALVNYGKASYGYIQVLTIMIEGFWLLFKHIFTEGRIRPIYPWELGWIRDTGALICTRAVDLGYDIAQASIIPDEFAPVPAAYKYAELTGDLPQLDFTL